MLIQHGFGFPLAICTVNIIFSILLFSKISTISIEHLLRIGWITNAWLIMKQTEHSHRLHQQDYTHERGGLNEDLAESDIMDIAAEDSWNAYVGIRS
ncbi:hypothetical protein K7432_009811 [Basidiobolus ranarum]|uniref:Uncharacterized protein n=1 Tax=Basidiobolus ranarum TaxID=34480 RepID=A0ABR2WPP2_9FUNG